MDYDFNKAFDFVTRNGISIKVVKVERNHPHPYEAGEVVDLYSVEVKRGTESFIKKWALGDLDLDDEDYSYPALVYGVLHRIPLYFQERLEEYARDCGAETEEQRRTAKIWYENDLELLANARRVFGELYDEIETVFSYEPGDFAVMKKENKKAVMKAISTSTLMHDNFSALAAILAYDGQVDDRVELSKYIQRRDAATSKAAKAKWYHKIISIFYSASATFHNGKNRYPDMVKDIDMDDLKKYLRDKAIVLLAEKVSLSSWEGKVRAAALKFLDLEELI